jgi:hypothetical protein
MSGQGTQTGNADLFVGYALIPLTPPEHHDAGGTLGLLGGLALIAAGVVALIYNARTQRS